MNHSFGYNRLDTDKSYDPADTLIADFVDAVSKNGNLLLNVGPRGLDAQIPDEQIARLKAFGAFMAANGEGLYDTVPWQVPEGTLAKDGDICPVRFTAKAGRLYAFVLERPGTAGRWRISANGASLPALSAASHLASGTVIGTEQDGDAVSLTLPAPLAGPGVHGFRLDPAGS